ncbi:saccharopine dehydrogenase domain-containing protein [Besnoitia besnoiti]|uniref:Saccharopine dehydrogenase domain-containing protein n=1 Tax=Besnoitia besnoiti TaxID=94643 RepID=A0A2A9MMI9_BESBE|nr:saccharopine dehydrogenase domain-containing protein [Besnoitia besnoiti]PFH37013.1 saccharopine dehydrogenase domain-containing protein [Besnoitia besnoiti]
MSTQPFHDADREFDLVAYGATGYTGRLVAEYLCKHYVGPGGELLIKFALAARSLSKLQEARQAACNLAGRSEIADKIPLIVADSANEASLVEMCKRTRVVVTTVGPYLKYGEPLVKACVEARTHYCDLVGEMPFIARTSKEYGRLAAERGVKIVHCCGFDSVPSDLSCLLLEEAALKTAGAPCESVTTGVTEVAGGFSGGTLDSLTSLKTDKDTFDPYYLCKHALPTDKPFTLPSKMPSPVRLLSHDRDLGYGGFFVMAPLNENVVRWSNALMDNKYGKNLLYREMVTTRNGGIFTNACISLCTYAVLFLVSIRPIRSLLLAFGLLPQPGEGPSRKTLESGYFEMRAVGRTRTASGKRLRCSVTIGSKLGDPGYHETAKMLSECGLSLALDLDKCTKYCGVGSPAATIGNVLKDRLEAKGFYFKVDADEEGQA